MTLDELRASYHAVIYAVGAATDRRLGVPGEALPGSVSATDFVAWYNGHPDADDASYPLSTRHPERAVVIGNGNVALDVARILTADPDRLATTDISDRALLALRDSRIREVVVLGRRGPADAAFTLPELIGLATLDDVDVVVEGAVEVTSDKTEILAELASRTPVAGTSPDRPPVPHRSRPHRRRRAGRVGLEVGPRRRGRGDPGRPGAAGDRLPRATGRRTARSTSERGLVPNDGGRVEPGLYVAGWIKRGPTGFLGTNKSCSKETVERLLDDLDAGLLTAPTERRRAVRLRGRRQRLARDRPRRARPRRRRRAAPREAHRPRRTARCSHTTPPTPRSRAGATLVVVSAELLAQPPREPGEPASVEELALASCHRDHARPRR